MLKTTGAADKLTKSASLILINALKKPGEKNQQLKYNYKVNLLKRSNAMSVWPGFHVFAGGKFDQNIDDAPMWHEVFSSHEPGFFKSLIRENSLSSLLKNYPNRKQLPLEVAFRLCAIRETFEETGILIAYDKGQVANAAGEALVTTSFLKNEKKLDALKDWHASVLKDSSQFIQMCRHLDLVPNVFSLHEWANWITPTIEKKRFDTFFFTCFFHNDQHDDDDDIPHERYLCVNKNEIEKCEVKSVNCC
jgi:nucleoside diphosphate-linked moiety X motif protein 19